MSLMSLMNSLESSNLVVGFEYRFVILQVLASRPHNRRIELPSMFDDEGEGGFPDDAMPDVDDEELTRDKVKATSNGIIAQEVRRGG
jgi:hypothetical protein